MSHITHLYHLSALDFINTSSFPGMAPWLPSYTASDMIDGSSAHSVRTLVRPLCPGLAHEKEDAYRRSALQRQAADPERNGSGRCDNTVLLDLSDGHRSRPITISSVLSMPPDTVSKFKSLLIRSQDIHQHQVHSGCCDRCESSAYSCILEPGRRLWKSPLLW